MAVGDSKGGEMDALGLLKSLTLLVMVSTVAILGMLPNCVLSGDVAPSTTKSLIWGPGLRASFNVPARYFFIQAVDTHGKNITHSLGENAFDVSISQQDGARMRVWVQLLDRHDGSYILRYKLFSSYQDVQISVQYKGKHVARSPYKLNGDVYHDKCDCPTPSFTQWLQDMECPKSYAQIKRDLSLFPSIDMKAVVDEAVSRFNSRGAHSLCHYVIKNNQIYRRTYGEHVGFKMFMDAILLSMARKTHLPDMEFLVNLGDWPLEKKSVKDNPIPILSWCGSDDTRDIVMPTYDITESTLQTMGRVSLDLMSVQANTGPAWENKTDKAIWRGRDSRQERLDLVVMSRKNPDLIDAKLTNMFFFKKDPDKYGELVKHISFFEFFKYKYQINLDGTVAAYRFPYLLAGDSLVFKQDSNYYEHFYKDLQPGVHYVPFRHDLSDLKKKLEWARDHPEQAKKVGQAGQQYARNNLLPQDVFCYHALLFKEYAKRLKNSPKVLADMELVVQSDDRDSKCSCHTVEAASRDEL